MSQNSSSEFFGLGQSETVDYVKVKWLNGTEDIIYNVEPNQQIHIVEGSTLSVNEHRIPSISIYPNPVRYSFTINSKVDINSVEIFNLFGQRVLSVYPNSMHSKINIANLTAGTYFAKIISGDYSKAIKVVKY